MQIPILARSNKIMSFNDWYDLYHPEVDAIIDDYISVIENKFSSELSLYHILDINEFSYRMKGLIYQKSISNLKSSLRYL